MHLLLLPLFLPLAHAFPPQAPLSPQAQYGPSTLSAQENANLIFASIYSSMRQWGSSIQHNGMSFFPAYVPEGTLLYHGGPRPERVQGMEWLAFEVQHAEMFAHSVRRRRQEGSGEGEGEEEILDLRNEPVWAEPEPEPPVIEVRPGYLHIYQTTRPLKLLYLDGMSAAKCDLGPMDTQDILLLNFTLHKFADRERAVLLCDLAEQFGVEGFVRMEAGFEIIKCDFSRGLDFISHKRRPEGHEPGGYNNMFLLDYIREVSGRYGGIDAGRVRLDYSSMVSAYFYPTNLSNPDQEPGQSILPRLVESERKVLERIKSDLRDALKGSTEHVGVDWQGVADMIVKRYSGRLQFIATDPPQKMFLSQINNLQNLFVDYGTSEAQDPIEVCAQHYLQPVKASTKPDLLIEAAFKTVTRRICKTLFEVRELLFEKERDSDAKELGNTNSAVELVRDLIKWLDWSDWKACGQCALHEVCFVAVFPFGTAEDHYNPGCVKNSSMIYRGMETNYWRPRNMYRPED